VVQGGSSRLQVGFADTALEVVNQYFHHIGVVIDRCQVQRCETCGEKENREVAMRQCSATRGRYNALFLHYARHTRAQVQPHPHNEGFDLSHFSLVVERRLT